MYKCPRSWALGSKDAMKSWETHINFPEVAYRNLADKVQWQMWEIDMMQWNWRICSHTPCMVCLKPFSHHFNFIWKAWIGWGEVELCSSPITVSKETISIKYLSHLPILKYYWEICWTENHKADLQLLPLQMCIGNQYLTQEYEGT